jgi:hypothetical protein
MKGLKIIDAKQATIINNFLNLKRKLLKANANIWFNKQALLYKVIPNYVKIKVTGTLIPAIKTQKLAAHIRIKKGLKYLYIKKQDVNNQLYDIHLKAAAYWGRYWNIIEDSINEKLKLEVDKKYDVLNKKLTNLILKQRLAWT